MISKDQFYHGLHNGNRTRTKTYADPKFPEENEINISSYFDDSVKLLESLNLVKKAYHETYREK